MTRFSWHPGKHTATHSLPSYSWKVVRTCFPTGGEEHMVFSWEPQHFQGLSSLPGGGSDGVSQPHKHDDPVFKTLQLALGSTTPTFQLFLLPTLSSCTVEVLGFPRPCPYHFLIHPQLQSTAAGRVLGIQGNSFICVAFWQDPYPCKNQCPTHYPYSTKSRP